MVGAGPAAIQQPRAWGSHKSKLIATIRAGHHDVSLSAAELERLTTWIDLNGVYYPSYASNFPNNEAGRSPLTGSQINSINSLTGRNVRNVKGLGEQVSFDRPASSPCLAGVTGSNRTQALAIIEQGKTTIETTTRADMPNFTMQTAMDLWRENKYQYRLQRERMSRAAIAAGGKVFDSQGLLGIAQLPPEGVDGISARIHGEVFFDGGVPVDVTLAWGAGDGGNDLSGWQFNQRVGTLGTGRFDYLLDGLTPGQPLFYRLFAQSAEGTVSTYLTTGFDTRSLIDLDGNGMADGWEALHFGGTGIAAPHGDWDHDGMTNLEEYFAGTDPADPQSRLSIISLVPQPDSSLRLRWQSADKVDYEIWRSPNLTDWTRMPGLHPATPPCNEIEIDPAGHPSYFFRIGGQHRER